MENINRVVRTHLNELKRSEHTFADIYRIMFSIPDHVMTEKSEGLEIRQTTYRQMDARIRKAAGCLSSLQYRDRFIALAAENSDEWIVLFWAILMSGNKPYLVNLRLPRSFTASILTALDCPLVLYAGKNGDWEIPSRSCEALFELPEGELSGFGDAVALSTSATTLKEKICIYSGQEFSAQILNTEYVLSHNRLIKHHDRGMLKQLAFLPMYHIFGLSAMFFWFCFFGRTLVFLPDYSADSILRTVRRHRVTHIFAVPLLWHTVEDQVRKAIAAEEEKTRQKFEKGLLLSEKLQYFCPSLGRIVAKRMFRQVTERLFGDSVAFCISGGSYIRQSALRLINALGYPLHNGYGMSEVGITSVELSSSVKERKLGSVGKPFPSIEYRIGQDGTLSIRGGSVCHRLMVNGEQLPQSDWFDTGDLAEKDEAGRYYIIGRKSDLVIGENGENLSPDLIEKELHLTAAENYCVLGDETNEQLMAVIQIPEDILLLRLNRIRQELSRYNERVPMASRLRKIYYTFDPIMSASAIKVSRDYLKGKIRDGSVKLMTGEELPQYRKSRGTDSFDEVSEILRELFASNAHVPPEQVHPDSHFITDLGGASLDYFNLLSEIHQRFGVRMKLDDDHLCYTVEDFRQEISRLL